MTYLSAVLKICKENPHYRLVSYSCTEIRALEEKMHLASTASVLEYPLPFTNSLPLPRKTTSHAVLHIAHICEANRLRIKQ